MAIEEIQWASATEPMISSLPSRDPVSQEAGRDNGIATEQ